MSQALDQIIKLRDRLKTIGLDLEIDKAIDKALVIAIEKQLGYILSGKGLDELIALSLEAQTLSLKPSGKVGSSVTKGKGLKSV